MSALVKPVSPAASPFDYGLPAEIYVTTHRKWSRGAMTYRRFATAAEAISFAIDELPASQFAGTVMEVGEERFDHQAIRGLHDDVTRPTPPSVDGS